MRGVLSTRAGLRWCVVYQPDPNAAASPRRLLDCATWGSPGCGKRLRRSSSQGALTPARRLVSISDATLCHLQGLECRQLMWQHAAHSVRSIPTSHRPSLRNVARKTRPEGQPHARNTRDIGGGDFTRWDTKGKPTCARKRHDATRFGLTTTLFMPLTPRNDRIVSRALACGAAVCGGYEWPCTL